MNADIKEPEPCYFMVADILGFSRMIRNLQRSEQRHRVVQWVRLVSEAKIEAGITDTQLISDTLFVKEEDSIAGLRRLLTFARILLTNGVNQSFPIRGAIVHGDAAWGELPYGEAVISAHTIEQSLDWIGVACSPDLPDLGTLWSWELVAVYPVPQKSGVTRLQPAIAWTVPESSDLLRKVGARGMLKEGDAYEWDVVTKVERAAQFGIYLRIAQHFEVNPSRFGFSCPMDAIERFMRQVSPL